MIWIKTLFRLSTCLPNKIDGGRVMAVCLTPVEHKLQMGLPALK